MDNNIENKKDSPGSKKKNDVTVKRNKSKNNSEKRSFLPTFGSRRKKKETIVTDSESNNDQNLSKTTFNTETDAGLRNPPSNDASFDDVPRGALMVTEAHAEQYFMQHPQRGKVIIFNHENFDKEDPREGTKADVEKIQSVFGEILKFEIKVYTDLEYVDLIQKVSKLSKEDYSNHDCIVIFVLTHGKKGGELSAKDMYYPADKLWEYFAGDKCVTLAGKPKLFFISACRGKKKDNGIRLFRGRTQTDSSKQQLTYKLPSQADFLISFSTVEGFYSYRDIHNGTWFVQCLCDVVSEFYKTTDLMKMLTITSRKIAIDYRTQSDKAEDCDQTQIPSITTMLIRDLFFYNQD